MEEGNTRGQRPQALTAQYLKEVERELAVLRHEPVEELPGIRTFAERLFVHPVHLSNTVKKVTGRSPCDFYEDGLVAFAKDLLLNTDQPIAAVARRLTMDPSNFGKFFKRFEGITPGQYRRGQDGQTKK